MAKQEFKVRYEFVPRTADGDMIYRTVTFSAKSAKDVLTIASIEGFKLFGAFFNDNCVDWRLI